MPYRSAVQARKIAPWNTQASGWLVIMGFEWFFLIGALVLLAVIGGAVLFNRGRNKAKDAITEAATREQYKHPERYARTQDEYRDAAKRED